MLTSEELIRQAKLPPLILDPVWLWQFPKDQKNDKMKALEAKIKNLMKENAQLNERKKVLLQKKKEYLDRIMENTPQAYEMKMPQAKTLMKALHRSVLGINAELISVTRKMEKIQPQIESVNTALLSETVTVAYGIMRESRRNLDVLEPEIDRLRAEIQKAAAEKAHWDEHYKNTYHLLHNLVGQQVLDLLDKEYETQEKGKWF